MWISRSNRDGDQCCRRECRNRFSKCGYFRGLDQLFQLAKPTKTCFFKLHPNQLADDEAIMKAFSCKDGSQCRWVSYSAEKHSLFCAVCLAFSKKTETNPFMNRCNDWRHIQQRLNGHEKIATHMNCVKAYFSWINQTDLRSRIDT